jgi:basic membrane protein A and related proteins
MTISRRAFTKILAAAPLSASLFPAGAARAAGKTTKVALLLPGSIADGGWNTLAYQGLKALDREQFKTAYTESVRQAQMEQVIRGYADNGYDLIIGHSYEYGSAFTEIGPDYAKTDFFASTFKPGEKAPANVEFVNMAYLQAAYAAGALAALISEKGKAVGTVGGGDNPTQQAMTKAFMAAAERTRPSVKGLGIVTGDYNNAAKGREAAATMIGNGADVIWHTADVTGLGAVQGAASAKVKAIGDFSDQTSIAPDYVATSFKQNLDWMVGEVAKSVADGAFKGGQEWQLTPVQGWTTAYGGAPYNPRLVTASQWAAFQDVWSKLNSGAIDVKAIVKS